MPSKIVYGNLAVKNNNSANVLDVLHAKSNIIDGLTLSNYVINPNNGIDIDVGICVDSTKTKLMDLTSILTKRLTIKWAIGTNQGGRPSTVSLSSNTWYHVFLIMKTDGTVDAGFDTSLTAANLLTASGFTYYRRIGSVRTGSDSNLLGFIQTGDDFMWKTQIVEYSSTAPPTTLTDLTLTTPLGLKTKPYLTHIIGLNSTVNIDFFVQDQNTGAEIKVGRTPVNTNAYICNSHNIIYTDTSSKIKHAASTANGSPSVTILSEGYNDSRGKN